MKNKKLKWLALVHICSCILGISALITGRCAPAILAGALIISASISYQGGTE